VLAFLAAVVPIIGSLYVAGSYLVEQMRSSNEKRTRYRVAEIANEHYNRIRAEQAEGTRPADISLAGLEQQRVKRMLLAANGLDEKGPSYTDVEIQAAMSGHVRSGVELRRQWVLLLSSAAGLVLLAIDFM
jgi:hypothetical protein